MFEQTGRCLCGAVHYRVTAASVTVRVCWCRDCQHLAANGTVNAIVPTAALAIEGVVQEFENMADSGNRLARRFCPQCGTHLFANSSARPQLTVVRVGTLDDPSSVRPDTNIWAASAPAWACLDPALERAERQPLPPRPPQATAG
jgi:hypothetical protein